MRMHFPSICLVLGLTGAISFAAESNASPHIKTIISDITEVCEEVRDWQRKCGQSAETLKVLYQSGHRFQPALFLADGKAPVSRETGTTFYNFAPYDGGTGFLLEKQNKQSGQRFEYFLTDCGLS